MFIFIDLKAVKEKVKDKEEPTERPGQSECKVPIIVIMVFTQLSLRVMIITGILKKNVLHIFHDFFLELF